MNINSSLNTPSLAYSVLSLFSRHTDHAFHESILAPVAQLIGPIRDHVTFEPSHNVGRMTAFLTATQCLILCNGVTSVEDALGWLQGYGVPPPPDGSPLFHRDAVTKGNQLTSSLAPRLGPANQNFLYCGHSAGGIVASYSAFQFRQSRETSLHRIMTFGAPRGMDTQGTRTMSFFEYRRYFSYNDVFVRVPPRGTESLPVFLLADREQLTNIGRWCQPAGGIEIAADGTLAPGTIPSPPDPVLGSFGVTNGTFEVQWFTSVNHQIADYLRLMTQYEEVPDMPLDNVPVVNVRENAMPGAPVETTTDEISRRQAASEIDALGRARSATVRAPRPFTVVKKLLSYAVLGAGTPIAMFEKRKPAKKMASGLNAAYAKWWNAFSGDAPTLGVVVSNVFGNLT